MKKHVLHFHLVCGSNASFSGCHSLNCCNSNLGGKISAMMKMFFITNDLARQLSSNAFLTRHCQTLQSLSSRQRGECLFCVFTHYVLAARRCTIVGHSVVHIICVTYLYQIGITDAL